jgi:UDP-N-acetylmuramate--alanine ligase
MQLFSTFKEHTRGLFIVNHDHALIKTLSQDAKNDFGTTDGAGYTGKDFKQTGFQILFSINGVPFKIPVIGKHNMENAMAAAAVAGAIGISIENSAKALESYVGIYRRTQLVGEKKGVYVIDDFAHNPAEVKAVIKACQQIGKRVIAWFQPHGFGPLRFMHEELAQKVSEVLRDKDCFIMSDVYYAGGTVNKDIDSDVVITAVQKKKRNAVLVIDRSRLPVVVKDMAQPGDVVLMMGARDPSLSNFAIEVLENL